MKLLIVTETLYPRGAETFVVRLANALSSMHDVIVLNLHPYWSKGELVQHLSKKVKLIERTAPCRWIKRKVDGALFRLNIDKSFTEGDIVSYISDVIKEHNVNVVHSHLFKPDYYVAKAKVKYNMQFSHVITNHGDYLLYNKTLPSRILNYDKKLFFLLNNVNHVVNISDVQMQLFTLLKDQSKAEFSIHKILNGYTGNTERRLTKADLGIPEDAFVFGMVASGIREKGWDEAIKAFELLNCKKARLLLVGEGKRLDYLKHIYASNQQIIFAGYSQYPLEYISCFDIGILPSYYEAESLPTSVIEYLYMGKPTIVTAMGDVEKMLETGDPNTAAGKIIYFNDPSEIVPLLAEEMKDLINNPEKVTNYKQHTRKAFEKFEMSKCIDAYWSIYSRSS